MGTHGQIVKGAWCLVLGAWCLVLSAAPVDADGARRAARNWVRRGGHFGGRFGSDIEKFTTHRTKRGASFYSAKMAGGGTLFLSSDTETAPVICFTSETNDYSEIDARSPLAALLDADLSARSAAGQTPRRTRGRPAKSWEKLLDEGTAVTKDKATGTSSMKAETVIGDLRVRPLLPTKWSQSTANGKACYNYYTPNGADPSKFTAGSTGNAVCGCVATAMSQVMRYHRYPTASIAQVTCTCTWENASGTETVLNLTTQGGTYDWEKMTSVPSGATMTADNYKAIGKLTSDAGITVYMGYSNDGSGAYSFDISIALKAVWGYKCALYYDPSDDAISAAMTDETRERVLQCVFFANFDAGYPVCVSIPGHAICADGYGLNDGFCYVHLNMGWSGQDDYWYNLPDMTEAGSSYTAVNSVTYNIFPDKDPSCAVLSGRTVDAQGNPIGGVKVSILNANTQALVAEVTSSEFGVWGVVLPAGTYLGAAISADGFSSGALGPVTLAKPTVQNTNYNSTGRSCPRVKGVSNAGNSWGNDITLEGVVSAPAFSPQDVTEFEDVLDVTLSSATEGATIRYTLDGSTPDETSPVYMKAIRLTRDTKVMARAYKEGMTPSGIVSQSYLKKFPTATTWTDAGGVGWSNTSTQPWRFAHPNTMIAGGLKNTAGANYTSTLKAVVPGKGALKFRWKVSSYSGSNIFTFKVGNTTKITKKYANGTTDYEGKEEFEVTSESGETFTWTYSISSIDYDYADTGVWLDDVEWIPEKPPYETVEPVWVTATRTRIVAGQRIEVQYRGFLTEKGLWYAWGRDGKAETEWKQGTGAPLELAKPNEEETWELMVR